MYGNLEPGAIGRTQMRLQPRPESVALLAPQDHV